MLRLPAARRREGLRREPVGLPRPRSGRSPRRRAAQHRPAPTLPQLTVPEKAYDGYPLIVVNGAPTGAQIAIERLDGANWTKVATTGAASGKAEAVVALAPGDRQLRATLSIGSQTVTSPPKHINVKKAAQPEHLGSGRRALRRPRTD